MNSEQKRLVSMDENFPGDYYIVLEGIKNVTAICSWYRILFLRKIIFSHGA